MGGKRQARLHRNYAAVVFGIPVGPSSRDSPGALGVPRRPWELSGALWASMNLSYPQVLLS